jgi:hypothetical protein
MRIRIKSIIVTVIIFQLIFGQLTYAQTSPSEKIRGVGNFFTSFFDLDNSVNYLRDTFVQNQCRKRDLFAIHAQKDAIADAMLDNYKTLSDSNIDDLKKEYSVLTGELTYVRNIGQKSQQELLAIVISKIRPRISNYKKDITAAIPEWNEKYDSRAKEYLECRNSWQEVKDQVENIKANSREIGENWSSFKEQFNKTGQELLDTPGNTYENVSGAVESIPDSFNQTIENFRDEKNRIIDDLSREEIDPTAAFKNVVNEELSRIDRQQNLAEILEREQSLTVIPGILRQQQEQFNLDQEAALDYAETRLEQSYSDGAAYVLWNDILQLNYNIKQSNELMSNEQDGLINSIQAFGSRQCSL